MPADGGPRLVDGLSQVAHGGHDGAGGEQRVEDRLPRLADIAALGPVLDVERDDRRGVTTPGRGVELTLAQKTAYEQTKELLIANGARAGMAAESAYDKTLGRGEFAVSHDDAQDERKGIVFSVVYRDVCFPSNAEGRKAR